MTRPEQTDAADKAARFLELPQGAVVGLGGLRGGHGRLLELDVGQGELRLDAGDVARVFAP